MFDSLNRSLFLDMYQSATADIYEINGANPKGMLVLSEATCELQTDDGSFVCWADTRCVPFYIPRFGYRGNN